MQLQKRYSQKYWLGFCALGFEGLLLVYMTYQKKKKKIGLIFVSKILVFEI